MGRKKDEKKLLWILLMGIMMLPQVVHSEELTSDIPMLYEESIIGVYNSAKGRDICWNAVTGATGYEVYRKRSGEGTKKVATTTNVNVTQCYDPGIKDSCWGRVYNYYVIPVAERRQLSHGNALSILTKQTDMYFNTQESKEISLIVLTHSGQ